MTLNEISAELKKHTCNCGYYHKVHELAVAIDGIARNHIPIPTSLEEAWTICKAMELHEDMDSRDYFEAGYAIGSATPHRKRLPDTKPGRVHKFQIGPAKGYIRVGLYEDGSVGELFVHRQKSEDAGLWGTIGILTSLCLQYGVPLDVLCKKLTHAQFAPRGPTKNAKIPMATSVPDYVFRYLAMEFGKTGSD